MSLFHQLGVHHACISPGARNSPLTFAFTEHSGIQCFSHADERSSAFFALGLAKSTLKPVVLICTSGTAGANYFPAVIEASLGRVPIIILTADRPEYIVGTGANQTKKQRFVATMSNVKAWTRTQENWVISVAPDVLENASPKLLHRIGLQALTYGSTIEGFGLGAAGRIGDQWGSIKQFRTAYDQGEYERVRELSVNSTPEDLNKKYTVREAVKKARESIK